VTSMRKSDVWVARTALWVILLVALVAGAPRVCSAADDLTRTRIGFSAGMLFSLTTGFSSLPEEEQAAGGSFGLGIDFALGGFITDQVSLHWSGHGHYLFSDASATVVGLGGPRITYYMERSAPCWYGSVTLGASSTSVLSGPPESAVTGGGASFAIGYEFRPHGAIELEVFAGLDDPGDVFDDSDERGSLVLVCLSVGSAGYRPGP
jgi:hypothetical protein